MAPVRCNLRRKISGKDSGGMDGLIMFLKRDLLEKEDGFRRRREL